MIARCGDAGELVINPIIYAEVSTQFDSIEELDDALPASISCVRTAAVGGRVSRRPRFRRYRRAGGVRRSPLPDFYIGAHAAIDGLTLLTRDPGRYRKYFRALTIIAP